jgi:hypothetical protein
MASKKSIRFALAIAGAVLLSGFHIGYLALVGAERVSAGPRLVKFEPLAESGMMCELMPQGASGVLMASLQAPTAPASARQAGGTAAEQASRRPPARVIKDRYAVYSSVADTVRNEVVMADENTFSILVYDRLTNTPPTAAMSEPKRLIQGPDTGLEFQCGIYIDPKSGDIYAATWPISRFYAIPGSGKFVPPSITVYPKDGNGKPKAVINHQAGLVEVYPPKGLIFACVGGGDSDYVGV